MSFPVCIRFHPKTCVFVSPCPRPLFKALSIPFPNYFFTPAYKNGYWDGRVKFVSQSGEFATGLLPYIFYALKTGKDPIKNKEICVPSPVKILVPKKYRKYFNPLFVKSYFHPLPEELSAGIISVDKKILEELLKYGNEDGNKILNFLDSLK